jgi:3-(3-hydroxy-phenyl)propionate hydroxylase
VFQHAQGGWCMPERAAKKPIVIAGAGPVGLCLALSLGRRGHRVIVLEQLGDLLDQVRRAGTIHPPTLEMLDELGLYQRLAPRGLKAPLVHYWDRSESEPIAVFDHAAIAGDTRFPFALQCDRLKVVEEASGLAGTMDAIDIRLGHALVDVQQGADLVTVMVQDRDKASYPIECSYFISCEGAHSIARKAMNIEFEGFAFPDRTMTLSINHDFGTQREYGYRNYILSPDLWANLFKWTDLWRLVLPADPEADPEKLLDDATIQQTLQRFYSTGKPYELIAKSLYTVHQRVAKTFRAGRVLLAGDAAHVNSPIGAMGMNSGIHDAVNLGSKLSRVLQGEADELLDLYVRQRRHAAVTHVQAMTIRNKRLMAEADPATRKQRHDELRRAAEDPRKCREFMLRASLIDSVREAASVL